MSLIGQYTQSKRKVEGILSAAENEMAKFEANTELSKGLFYYNRRTRKNNEGVTAEDERSR